MRLILIIVLMFSWVGISEAREYNYRNNVRSYYNSSGSYMGRSIRSGRSTRYYNAYGRSIGSSYNYGVRYDSKWYLRSSRRR